MNDLERRHAEEVMSLVMEGVALSGNSPLGLEEVKRLLVRSYVLVRKLREESRPQPVTMADCDEPMLV